MPAPNRLAPGGFVRCNAATAAVSGVSLAWIASAVLAAWSFANEKAPGPLVAPSALVLVVCGLLQAWMMWRLVRCGQLARTSVVLHFAFVRRMALAAALAYLVALAIGPERNVGWAWLAVVALAQTLLLLPLAATPRVAEDWRRWTEGHTPRQLSWLVYAAL